MSHPQVLCEEKTWLFTSTSFKSDSPTRPEVGKCVGSTVPIAQSNPSAICGSFTCCGCWSLIERHPVKSFFSVHFHVCGHVFERLILREPSSKPTHLGPSHDNKLQLAVAVAALCGKKLARAKETKETGDFQGIQKFVKPVRAQTL
jgi:hypothetical protein